MTRGCPPAYNMVMGGRGAKLNKNTNPYGSFTNALMNGGGGGGGDIASAKANTAGGGGADVSNFTVVSHSIKYDSMAGYGNDFAGSSITIRDNNGVEHKSIAVSSGISRTTFIFKDFVIKIEGLKTVANRYKNQNDGDLKFYKRVDAADKKYFAKPLSANKSGTMTVQGTAKTIKMYAAERVVPLKTSISASRHASLQSTHHRLVRKYGMGDLRFPDRDGFGAHNVYITSDGFAYFDYGLN